MKYDTINLLVEEQLNENYEAEIEEYNKEKQENPEEWWLDKPIKGFVIPTLLLNDEPYGYHISAHSLITTSCQKDCYTYYYHGVDHSLLNNQNRSLFEPFTCSCGNAGCAGIWDGVHMKVRGHSVEWRMGKDAGYDFLPKRFWQFNKEQYFTEVSNFKIHYSYLAEIYGEPD